MKFILPLLCSSALFASATANGQDHNHHNDCPRTRHGCLCQDDVDYILSLWPRIFDTEDASWLNNTIDCIVADDFVSSNDEKIFFGIGINVPSRDVLLQEQLANIEFESGYPNTRGHITNVFALHSCDQIAFRWQYNGYATGNTKCTSTSNTVNHTLEFKGIDFLTIKKGTLQVENVTTSADGVTYSLGIGSDFSGSPICPGTVIPPPDTSCPPIGAGGSFPPIEPHAACAP